MKAERVPRAPHRARRWCPRVALRLCEPGCRTGWCARSTSRSCASRGKLQNFPLVASGTEGYRTAEVTLGGVDTPRCPPGPLNRRLVPGLYFIGEVLDVTGWLGGYNFQWAWACGHAAGSVA